MNAWKVIVSTLVIFIAGIVTGGLLVTLTLRFHPEEQHPRQQPVVANNPASGNPWIIRNRELLKRMDRELDLTPEQHTNIDLIIAGSQERLKILFRSVAPMMNKEMQRVHGEIAKELTPEQRKKFEGLTKPRAGLRRNGTNSPAMAPGTNAIGTNALPPAEGPH